MKIYYYTLLFATLMVLFNIAGFDVASSSMVTKLGLLNLENYSTFSFWATLALVFAGVGIAGSIVGYFVSVSPTYALKGIFIMGVLTTFIGDLIGILNLNGVTGWIKSVLLLIIAPLAVGYAIALSEFWEGRD